MRLSKKKSLTRDKHGHFVKGHSPWHKGKSDVYSKDALEKMSLKKKGKKLSLQHRERIKLSAPRGIEHVWWKGDNVSYGNLHTWVKRYLGKPKFCVYCQTTKARKFEWANISKTYKRELSDWIRLCTSCHRLYDYGKIRL